MTSFAECNGKIKKKVSIYVVFDHLRSGGASPVWKVSSGKPLANCADGLRSAVRAEKIIKKEIDVDDDDDDNRKSCNAWDFVLFSLGCSWIINFFAVTVLKDR